MWTFLETFKFNMTNPHAIDVVLFNDFKINVKCQALERVSFKSLNLSI
jgi:hypothetical protein